ncbi:MAG: flagellar hook-basal body complex protein, partial [Limnobacter sp.]|nr:flagellar hook-basal body complex protein [Limnobacter sp.]
MMRSLWIAKTGLDAQQTQLDVISNNLANTATNGFKRSRAVFEDLLYQTLRQPGAQTTEQTQVPSGLQIGTGVKPVSTVRNFAQGNLQQTGNTLDVAIQGEGWFAVNDAKGNEAYTRNGSFQLDGQGNLVTQEGYSVIGSNGPINVPPDHRLSFEGDGSVSAIPISGDTNVVQLGRLKLVNIPEGEINRGDDGLFRAANGDPAEAD